MDPKYNQQQMIDDTEYYSDDLVSPEDREYFEGFMNRYYPSHAENWHAQSKYGDELLSKQMRDKGYTPAPEGGWHSKTGGWTYGNRYSNDSAWLQAMNDFDNTRKGTLINEIKRKHPDWPDQYVQRVADSVYDNWNTWTVNRMKDVGITKANQGFDDKGKVATYDRDFTTLTDPNNKWYNRFDSYKNYTSSNIPKLVPNKEKESTQNVVSGVQGIM